MTWTTSGARSTTTKRKDAASYYIQASETSGEPSGRWWGPAPRPSAWNPARSSTGSLTTCCSASARPPDGTQLGRPPDSGRKAADIYAKLLAAEPHATAERKHELRLQATRPARLSPLFFDLTLSLSKSISIFHASLWENARLAREAGPEEGHRYWSEMVAEVDAMIW
jgi:hypothetical protein